ncbi:MAG: DUF2066 domain-containing protein [Proteobacteria bacterium]|nr:DUF2066 domain-containing protein [Pseudomonadota bacterium]
MALRGAPARFLIKAFSFVAVCLLVAGLYPAAGWGAEDEDRIFTVKDLPIDETAESAAVARDLARADGQRRALDRVLRRMVLQSDFDRIPRLEDNEISALVQAISVTDEKTSSTRYLANLTVRLKKDAVRNFLRDLSLSYAETVSKPRLVLPVYEAAGATLLWDDPNPWRSAWETRDTDDGGAVPLILPRGDRGDLFAIGAAQVLAGDTNRLSAIARRYNVEDVLVAHAILQIDLAANVPRLNVTLREVGPAGNAVIVQSFSGVARDRIPELLVRAAAEATLRLEEDWKRDNILRFDNPDRLSVRVPIGGLEEWVDIRSRLEGSAVVRKVVLTALSRTGAQVILHYLGEPAQLVLDLSQRDLDLVESNGFWTLALRGSRRR